jgi:hypothetical protein
MLADRTAISIAKSETGQSGDPAGDGEQDPVACVQLGTAGLAA